MKTRKLFTVEQKVVKPSIIPGNTYAITRGNETVARDIPERFAVRELFDREIQDPMSKFRMVAHKDSREYEPNDHGILEPTGRILTIY
jgi:hypothetical protein